MDAVRDGVSRSLPLAEAAQRPEYVASARAGLAWAAWRSGDLTEAEAQASAALEIWGRMPYPFPFEWQGRWPLLALALARSVVADAVAHARALLAYTQQRLPDAIDKPLTIGVDAWDVGQPEAARAALQSAMASAASLGYL